MFYLNFQIQNPFNSHAFKIGKFWFGDTFIPNKSWQVQTNRTSDIINFSLNITTRRDHAGMHLELGLLSFNISFDIYDRRHWENGIWI